MSEGLGRVSREPFLYVSFSIYCVVYVFFILLFFLPSSSSASQHSDSMSQQQCRPVSIKLDAKQQKTKAPSRDPRAGNYGALSLLHFITFGPGLLLSPPPPLCRALSLFLSVLEQQLFSSLFFILFSV